MIKITKKYSILLVLGLVLSDILAGIILLAIPNFSTYELAGGETLTLSYEHLNIVAQYLINIGFMILLSKDMGKKQIKSNLILIMTFFSPFIGVLLFLLSVAQNKYNQPKIEMDESPFKSFE
jgi:uncharacterized membrane-anchored protein YitT (DUF2179 family)